MKVWLYLGYVLACQLYTLRLALYGVHSALVFLSKPGARILVPVVLFALVYFLRAPLDAALGEEVDALWGSVVRPILGSDLAALTQPLNIELTALALLLLLVLVMLLLASMLQPVVGALRAPRLPLPPLPPMVIPDTEVKAVPVTRLLAPQRPVPLPNGLTSLSQGLPEELQALLTPEGARDPDPGPYRPLRPPAAPSGGGGQGGRPPSTTAATPVRPTPPPQQARPSVPPPPSQVPERPVPPSQRPKG